MRIQWTINGEFRGQKIKKTGGNIWKSQVRQIVQAIVVVGCTREGRLRRKETREVGTILKDIQLQETVGVVKLITVFSPY